MPKQVECQGLCSTCNNAASCTLSRDSDRPVLECEEFDSYELLLPKTVGHPNSRPKDVATDVGSEEDVGSDNYIGLCKTCEERESCEFPKREGGVWRCEEYR